MGHELAGGFSGFHMQKLLSLPHSSRVVLRVKGVDHTWFYSPPLHGCMPWGWGLASPHVPLPHSQLLVGISLFSIFVSN